MSARQTFTRIEALWGAIAAVLLAACLRVSVWGTLTGLLGAGVAVYLGVLAYKARLVHHGWRAWALPPPAPPLADGELPAYTVLVPLYREANVVDELLEHLGLLDYPADRLQVLLLCEADDAETVAAVEARALPDWAELVVCPDGVPRTKPRACNVGLGLARGDLLVIYDAEDRPEPDQLRVAAAAFAASPPERVCLQARLDYHNSDQNLLTRFFAVEYNQWFDLLLPALSARGGPVPLGGTSNHFRTEVLRRLGGWDPWNVTEDADLGIRIYTEGYTTGVIDSITWEEACSRVRPWLRQRTRWVKGYLQTFLVHTRDLGWVRRCARPGEALLGFGVLVGGTPVVNLLNPLFWGLLLFHAVTRSDVVVRVMPGPVLYAGVVSFVAGNLLLVYAALLGVERRGRWHLARAALASPVYWLLMSVASYRAVAHLVLRPHLWEKTPHGLTAASREPVPAPAVEPAPELAGPVFEREVARAGS